MICLLVLRKLFGSHDGLQFRVVSFHHFPLVIVRSYAFAIQMPTMMTVSGTQLASILRVQHE